MLRSHFGRHLKVASIAPRVALAPVYEGAAPRAKLSDSCMLVLWRVFGVSLACLRPVEHPVTSEGVHFSSCRDRVCRELDQYPNTAWAPPCAPLAAWVIPLSLACGVYVHFCHDYSANKELHYIHACIHTVLSYEMACYKLCT